MKRSTAVQPLKGRATFTQDQKRQVHGDRRTKRQRTRAAVKQAAIREAS